jgi:hypothetical protein
MKHSLLVILGLCAIYYNVVAQAKTKKLPNNINHPSINVYAPYMSFDANALVFLSDNSEDNIPAMVYSMKENADWKDPVAAPKPVNTRLNFLRGYSLSADGKKLYFTSMKSPGVGGYDILVSDYKGSTWADPLNFGTPINSKSNEACASFTPDGNTIYFMRCDKMNQDKAEGCKIFMSKKKSNGQWEEPAELPAQINTGNSQTPRILADAETLIFSSDKLKPSKGGMDLFITKFQNGTWTNPVALDFANTEKDDQYISVNALGRYLLRDSPGARKNELVEYLIPNDIRPKGMMKIDGKVTDPAGVPTPAYISIIDLKTNKRIYSGRPTNNGSFLVYLMEGSQYEISIDPEQSNITYFAKQFDLTTDKIPQSEKVNAVLKPVAAGDELSLEAVKFLPATSNIDPVSFDDLKRLARVVKANPQFKFEIQVLLKGYEEDSIRSNADLTETIYDSLVTQMEDIDSLGQKYTRDTLELLTTYSNDRTLKQAQAVIKYLSTQGADPAALSFFVNAIEALKPEDKKITVKAFVRSK